MSIGKIISWLIIPKNYWLAIFIGTIAIGLFIQIIFLPYLFPQWHDGNGLLIGVDGSKFHRIALQSANDIKENGWSSWQLLPEGQLVSGIASIFYVLIYPAPWSVLPINGLLNATACLALFLIINIIINDKKTSLLATLPFIFFPSNLLWNTQFHNENYAIPGVMLLLFGWSIIIIKNSNIRNKIIGVMIIFIGSLLLGLVREYILEALMYLFILLSMIVILTRFVDPSSKRELFTKSIIFPVIGCASIYFALFIVKSTDQVIWTESQKAIRSSTRFQWERTSWIPSIIDDKLKDISKYRFKFTKAWDNAGSNIDTEISLNSSYDVMRFIPRAAQIGFFAPFPDLWFSQGKKIAGSAMRLVTSFEMIFIYIFLFGLPIFLWRSRHNMVLWMVVLICSAMIIIYAITIPNLGALYRFRYPYLMPIVCLGLAGWFSLRIGCLSKGKAK